MSFFKKLFGNKQSPDVKPTVPSPLKPAVLPPKQDAVDPSKDPNMIWVCDDYGRKFFIRKEEWRKSVLPGAIQSNWNNPDQLFGVVMDALRDGFRSDVLAAVERLYQIDSHRERATCIWGIVLMAEGRLEEAEKVFRDFLARHGESGCVLTNLAQLHAKRNETAKSEEILWRALELDPNQDNAVGWYWTIHKERGGEAAGNEALRRVAANPKSWRAQAWLARIALQSRDLERALALYRESLSRAGKPIAADLLMQISGDLGNAGHLPEILQLVLPHFDVTHHGLLVGGNLIKAHLDLGQLDAVRHLIDQHYALNRVDWKEHLAFWDEKLTKARLALNAPATEQELKILMLTVDGPVWLKPDSPATELFPAKTGECISVCFLGSTADMATNSKRSQSQRSNLPGQMSRALPLFLAEQTDFSAAPGCAPWCLGF